MAFSDAPDDPVGETSLLPRTSRRQVLSDGAYEALLSLMMDGSIGPDEPLRAEALAQRLGVSQTPIREALPRLEAIGLVTRAPLRGYRVAPRLTPEDVDKIIEARLLLEPHCAAVVCHRHDASVIAQLTDALREMRDNPPTGPNYQDFRRHLNSDARFHNLIAENCGNRFVADAVFHLGSHVQRFRLYGGGVTDAREAVEEHTAVLEAIQDGTPEETRAAMVRHLENVRQRATTDAAALLADG